jgi:small subunit ribosomal protein S21
MRERPVLGNIELKGTGVEVKHKNYLGNALKIFKRKVKESGKLEELKTRSYFEKPSVTKRREKEVAKFLSKR